MPAPHPLPALTRALGADRAAHLRPGAPPVVVLGVGSELRSDDAVGLHVARAIGETRMPNVRAIAGGPAPENRTGEIRALSPSLLIIVDAADMSAEPGTIRVLDPDDVRGASFATHGLPLSVLASYLRIEIGCRVILIGIQPLSISFGESISAEAEKAARSLVAALVACLSDTGAAREDTH
jgi:hydrogenase 3 maturation protease